MLDHRLHHSLWLDLLSLYPLKTFCTYLSFYSTHIKHRLHCLASTECECECVCVCLGMCIYPIFGAVLSVLQALETLRYTGILVDFCRFVILTAYHNTLTFISILVGRHVLTFLLLYLTRYN